MSSAPRASSAPAPGLASQFSPRPPGASSAEDELPSWLPTSSFAPGLFSEDNVAALARQYQTSAPYRHVRIDALGDPAAMLAVRREIVSNLATVDRETDLFKVSQTMDLNNIPLSSPAAPLTPHLMALRTHMYSTAFRSFLERVTGCGTLSPRVDCAANIYSNGSHLLCHDDVITTRKLSYIIYLSKNADEDDALAPLPPGAPLPADALSRWDPAHGGGLELYPAAAAPLLPADARPTARLDLSGVCGGPISDAEAAAATCKGDGMGEVSALQAPSTHVLIDSQGQWVPVPLSIPSRVIPPAFNSMVVFEVKPGQSFHAVQEVYTHSAKRVSIQGWFHFAGERPAGYDWGATVRLLQVPATVPLPRALALPPEAAAISTALTPALAAPALAAPAPALATDSSHSSTALEAGAGAGEVRVGGSTCEDEWDGGVYGLLTRAGQRPVAPAVAALVLQDMCAESAPIAYHATADCAAPAGLAIVAADADADAAAAAAAAAQKGEEVGIAPVSVASVTVSPDDAVAAAVTALTRWQEPGSGAALLTRTALGNLLARVPSAAATGAATAAAPPAAALPEPAAEPAPEEAEIGVDLPFLRSWLSPAYTHVPTLRALRARADATGVVSLGSFLRADVEAVLTAALIRADVEDGLALVPAAAAHKTKPKTAAAAAKTEVGAEAEVEESVDVACDGDKTKKKRGLGKARGLGRPKTAAAAADSAATLADDQKEQEDNNDDDDDTNNDENKVCTSFLPKATPPPYDTGVSPLYPPTVPAPAPVAAAEAVTGAWRLRGPVFRLRVCEYDPTPLTTLLSPAAAAAALGCPLPSHGGPCKPLSPLPLLTAALRKVPASQRAGLLLSALTQSLFASAAFARLLHWLTGTRPRLHATRVRRYRSGLDYSVGTYDTLLAAEDEVELMVAFTIVDQGQADKAGALWSAGSSTVSTAAATGGDCAAGDSAASESCDCELANDGALALPIYPGWATDKLLITTAADAVDAADAAAGLSQGTGTGAGAGTGKGKGKGKKAAPASAGARKGKARVGGAAKKGGKKAVKKGKKAASTAAEGKKPAAKSGLAAGGAGEDEADSSGSDGSGDDAADSDADADAGPGPEAEAEVEAELAPPAPMTTGSSFPAATAAAAVAAAGVAREAEINAHAMRSRGEALSKRALWDKDDCGGFTAHVPIDRTTEGDNAEQYVTSDDDDEDDASTGARNGKGRGNSAAPKLVSISAESNTLTIVRKRPGVLTFTRYINGMAPGSKWSVESRVICAPEDEDEDE